MSTNTNWEIWVAGAVAAFAVDLIVYPLDTLKTRLQSPEYKKRYTNAATHTVNRAVLFRGLYQGVGSVIIASAFFTTYEGVKHTLSNRKPSGILPDPVIHSAASAAAELVSCAILTPAEVIKQNAQIASKSPDTNATLQTLQKFRSNPLGLWRGYTALASRNLPFTAMQFPLFEHFKAWIKTTRERKGQYAATLLESGAITAASAGIAALIAAIATTPVDVVKTRIMLAAAENAARERPSKSGGVAEKLKDGALRDAMGHVVNRPFSRKNSLQIGREIIAEYGIKGLWRGGSLRGLWSMLGSALYLGTYESGRIWLASRRGEKLNEEDIL